MQAVTDIKRLRPQTQPRLRSQDREFQLLRRLNWDEDDSSELMSALHSLQA